MNGTSAWNMLKETFSDWSEDNATRLAAALAYYTAFAIAPLLVIAIAIAGFFLGRDLTAHLGRGRSFAGAEGEDMDLRKTASPGGVKRGGEIGLGLAREAYDDVGGYCRVIECFADQVAAVDEQP